MSTSVSSDLRTCRTAFTYRAPSSARNADSISGMPGAMSSRKHLKTRSLLVPQMIQDTSLGENIPVSLSTVLVCIDCECRLAIHLTSRPHEEPSPLGYLGVPKLSCLRCWTFLQILGKYEVSFHTGATHSKVYLPWAWPLVTNTVAFAINTGLDSGQTYRHIFP